MQDDLPDDLVFPQDGPALQQDTLGVGVGVPPPVPDQAPSIEGIPDDLVFPQQPGTWQSLANSAERGARALYRDWQDLPGQVQGMEMAADLQRRIAAGEDSLWTRRFLDNPELLETFRRNYAENVATSAPIVAEQNRQISALPQHPAAEAMQRAQTWGEAWDHFTSAPLSVIANIGLESLVRQSPGLVAGAVAGAAGGVPALMATIGLGSAHTEYMGGIFDALTEAGVDITNADALRQALSNPELMERIRHQSAVKAGVVGAFDAASGGLASRVLLPATTLAARPVARHLTNIGVQIPTQGAMGGAGEALGSVASGQEVRPGAVMGEIVGEAFGAPAEVLGARHARGRTATEPPPQNQVPPAAQPAPAAEDQVPPVPPQEPAQPQAAISGFYAPAERAIETSRRVQGPPQAWFNDLKKAGVSNDELDWMGFPQWMEENRGRPVSREEMAEFVRENGANLVEVRQENEANGDLTQEELNFLNTQSVHETGRTFDQLDDSGKRELMNVLGVRQPTRYSSNFPAGVTNPRNFLVQVPGLNYQSPHFGGPTVSFIRVGDVAGPNGERVLLVHGNQSELHQEAEKRGYGDPPAQTGWETLDSPRVPVPNAPLKGDRWWQLGLKLALRQAVAEGYDAVAISTADQVKATDGNAPKSLYDSKMPSWLGKYVKPMGGVVEQAMTVPKNQRKKFSSREEALAAFPQGSTLNGAFPTWTVHAPGRRTIFGRSVGDRIGSINQLYDNEFEPLFRDPDYASSVLYESVPRYHPLVRITPQMRESIAKGQPLFSAHNSPTTKNAQESALDAVHEGGTADVPIRVADGILNDIRSGPSSRYLQMVPTDYEVGSLIMLEHVGDGHPNGDVNAVFLTTNDTYTSMRLPLSALDSLGALHVSPGYTDSGVGGLFFLRFDLPGEFSKRLAGELRHEAGHALRSSGKLRGKVWQRLLSHAHSLSSMGMSVRDYLFAKGDAYWQSAPESTTVNKAYTRIYEGRPDFQEVMDQEHVMVMLELHHHGYFSDEQMAPVRDILDAMESGSVARGEGVASSAEPVAAIAPPQSPRDLEDALQKLPPRTVGDITVETVRDRPSFGSITYVAKNSRNQKIGSFRLRMMSLTEVAVTNARVLDKFQRKGVASRVYDVIARDVGAMGMTLRPQGIDAGQMSDDAFAFWMKRDPSAIVRVADEEIALYGQLLMGGKEATKRYEQAKAKATPSKPVMAINGDEEAYQKAFEAQQRRKQMKQGKIAGGRMPPDQIARLNFARYSQGMYGSTVALTDEERSLGYEHVSEVVFDDVYGQQVRLRELSARLPGSWEDGKPPLLHSLRDADSGKFFYRGAPDIILSSELRQIAEQIVAHRLGLPPRSSGPVLAIAGVRAPIWMASDQKSDGGTTSYGRNRPRRLSSSSGPLFALSGEGRATEGAEAGAVGGFQTAKGSTYVFYEDGTTTRNKAARPDVGHEGDSGPKPRSEKTVYVTHENGQRLGPPDGVQSRVIDHGDGTLSLATLRPDGKWGISPDQRNFAYETAPRIGLEPVELWRKETVYGRDAYRTVHLGNAITQLSDNAPATSEAGTGLVPVTPPPLPPSSGGGSGMVPPGGGRGGRRPPPGDVSPPDRGGGPGQLVPPNIIEGARSWTVGDWMRAARDKWYSLGRTAETWWNPINGLPQLEQYRIGRYRMLGRIGHGEEMTKLIWRDFKDASKADKQAAYTYLTTRGASEAAIVDPKVRQAALASKRLFNALGVAAVDRGLISSEALEKYRDRYLPRLYLEHILRKGSMLGFSGNSRPSDLGWTKHRSDIDKETRVLMGEILDPGYLAARGIFRMHRDMQIIDFLSAISENDDWVFARGLAEFNGKRVSPYFLRAEAEALRERAGYEPDDGYRAAMLAMATDMETAAAPFIRENENVPNGYKQIPDTKRYGMLRGMYVRREIADDLLPTMSLIPEDANWYEKFLSPGGAGGKFNALWKAYHVPLNPSTQLRNIMSNAIMMNLSGMGPHRVAEYLGKAVKQMATNGPIYKIAVDMGLKTSGFSEQELRNVSEAWLKAEQALIRENAYGTLWYPWQIVKHVHDTVLRKAGDLYNFSDGLFKVAMMIDAVERQGMTPEQGFLHAQKWLFDYSDVSKAVRYLRSSPVGIPFASYYYKALPRIIETAATKPWRFLPYVILPYMMGQLFMHAWDAYDDDEDKRKNPNRPNPVDRLAMTLPEYLRSKDYAFIMPGQDARGRWQFFDFGYLLPWSMFHETVQSARKGEITNAMRQAGFLGGPLLSLYQFVASKGTDSFTGRKVIDPRDPPSTQIWNTLGWMWDQTAPPLLTSKGALAKLRDAYNEVPERSGDPGLTMAQAVLRLFGLNVYPVDPDTSRGRQISRMVYEIKEAEKRRRSILRDQSLSPEARQREDDIRRMDIVRRRRELQEYQINSEVHPRLRTERPQPSAGSRPAAPPNDIVYPQQNDIVYPQ